MQVYKRSCLLYVSTPAVFVYYSNLALPDEHNTTLLRVAVDKRSFFSLKSIVASTFYRVSCTASDGFQGVEGLYMGGTSLCLSQGALDFVKYVGFFELGRGYTFGFSQAYLIFHRIVDVDWKSDGSIAWHPYGARHGLVSKIPA